MSHPTSTTVFSVPSVCKCFLPLFQPVLPSFNILVVGQPCVLVMMENVAIGKCLKTSFPPLVVHSGIIAKQCVPPRYRDFYPLLVSK